MSSTCLSLFLESFSEKNLSRDEQTRFSFVWVSSIHVHISSSFLSDMCEISWWILRSLTRHICLYFDLTSSPVNVCYFWRMLMGKIRSRKKYCSPRRVTKRLEYFSHIFDHQCIKIISRLSKCSLLRKNFKYRSYRNISMFYVISAKWYFENVFIA